MQAPGAIQVPVVIVIIIIVTIIMSVTKAATSCHTSQQSLKDYRPVVAAQNAMQTILHTISNTSLDIQAWGV